MSAVHRPARSSAGSARGWSIWVQMIRASARAAAAGQGSHHAGDILVGHRPDDEGDRRRLGLAAAGQERTEVVEGPGQDRATGRVVGAVEEDLMASACWMQLEPAGPAGVGVAPAAGIRLDRCDSGVGQGIEDRVRDSHVGGLVPPAQTNPGRTEAGQLDLDPVTVEAEERGRRRQP